MMNVITLIESGLVVVLAVQTVHNLRQRKLLKKNKSEISSLKTFVNNQADRIHDLLQDNTPKNPPYRTTAAKTDALVTEEDFHRANIACLDNQKSAQNSKFKINKSSAKCARCHDGDTIVEKICYKQVSCPLAFEGVHIHSKCIRCFFVNVEEMPDVTS